MREIVTTIDVAAAPDIVWKILPDFGSYPEWNPFIPEVVGLQSKERGSPFASNRPVARR